MPLFLFSRNRPKGVYNGACRFGKIHMERAREKDRVRSMDRRRVKERRRGLDGERKGKKQLFFRFIVKRHDTADKKKNDSVLKR